MNKRVLLFVLGLFVMLALTTGAALANPVTGDYLCGTSGPFTGPNGVTVKKDVFCNFDRHWTWDILKTADQSNLVLSLGQTFLVNYKVTVNAASTTNYNVSGNIGFTNRGAGPVTISSVTDALGPVTCEDVTGFPFVLNPGATVICNYSGSAATAAEANTATVTDINGVQVSAVAPINWSQAPGTETGKCINVDDSYAGYLGQACANGQTSFEFTYSRTIGPYSVCGDYVVDNTAVIRETGSSSSANVKVKVPCASSCTLTPGYWKTHSLFGPAPYDDTWAQLGENTAFFSSGKSYYQALWTPPQGNAYWILAHAYIAAKINKLNGADLSAAQAAFDAATALFSSPTNTPAYVAGLRGAAKSQWTNLATTLDNYNNGLIGPGHCSE